MASRTGYFDRTNNQWITSDTNSAALTSEDKLPFIKYSEQLSFNLEVKTVSNGTVSNYTGWATGGPYTFAFAIDDNYVHQYDGVLTSALSGAITQITADGFSTTPANTGKLKLRNSSGNEELVSYTAVSEAAGVYTFTVSTTLTYTYADNDLCSYISPVLVAVANADIDQTNVATGKLVVDMDAETAAFLAAVQGSSDVDGSRFELQVFDGSSNLVDTISGTFRALNVLFIADEVI